MTDEPKDPKQFAHDGRDRELVAFWRITMHVSHKPFRREDVPAGVAFEDFWRDVLHRADTTFECVERLHAYLEGRPPVLSFDSHLTTNQRWMRHQRELKCKAKRQVEPVDIESALKNYVQDSEAKFGPKDDFLRFMKSLLRPTEPPSSPS